MKSSRAGSHRGPSLSLLCILGASLGVAVPAFAAPGADGAASATQGAPTSLQAAFTAAAREFGVPESVLLSVSYNVSRWEHHAGAPSASGGYGPMHLTHIESAPVSDLRGSDIARASGIDLNDPSEHTLDAAAQLLGVDPGVLMSDPAQNIRGGAALLAQYGRYTVGHPPLSDSEWFGAVALYSGSSDQPTALDFANTVYTTLQQGASRTTFDGQAVSLFASNISPDTSTANALSLRANASLGASGTIECPSGLSCEYIPAAYALDSSDPSDYGNYDIANNPANGLDIRYIVIHDTEVNYTGTLRGFQNPHRYASAHYVVRSADGHIAQMIATHDVAWHAGNWNVNMHAIGIEHEGVAIEGAAWYNEQLYHASSRLVRYLAHRYHIPLDRNHIVGHDNVPGTKSSGQAGMHWDPGPFWDWGHYMELLKGSEDEDGEEGDSSRKIVTISPDFRTNQPPLTYCYTATNCRSVPAQPSSFVYLYTAPSFSAPLVSNPFLHSEPTRAYNWGNKASTGQQFYLAGHQADWDAIYFSGQVAWFYNPDRVNTRRGRGLIVTPRAGLSSIPVYGRAYPEAAAYPANIAPNAIVSLDPYSIPAGQRYVAIGPFHGDYYFANTYATKLEGSDHTVVAGQNVYYQISFNHRFAFVMAQDVDVVSGDDEGDDSSRE